MDGARVLITGGCGLQGSRIVEQLLRLHPTAQLFVFSRKPDLNHFPGVEYIAGSTTSPDDVHRVFEHAKPTVVFHVAGLNANAPVGPDVMRAVNLDATKIMLEESEKAGVKAFIYSSSSSVVSGSAGRMESGSPIGTENVDETHPTATEPNEKMLHPYVKAESERLVTKADTPGGMRTVIIRSALIYGERDTMFLPMFLALMDTGKLVYRLGDGKNIISFTYAGNAAQFQIMTAERLLSRPDGVGGEVFFNTDKEQPSFYDFARSTWAAAGHQVADSEIQVIPASEAIPWAQENLLFLTQGNPAFIPMMAGLMMMSRYFNNGKGERVLGWKQPLSQKDAVDRSVKWYLANKQKANGA